MIQVKTNWTSQIKNTASDLHEQLTIGHKEWHQFKGNPQRRAAELISAAIAQLICGGKEADAIELIEQSLLWLKGDIKDPGCPHK